MPEFPRSPRITKGALALYDMDSRTSAGTIVVFQYNPDQVRRTLTNRTPPQGQGGGAGGANAGAREDVLRVSGPPVEAINLSIVLNAADQLADPSQNPKIAESGLYAALAALELAMYPPTLASKKLEDMAAAGEYQVKPANLPLTLLVWNASRVAPVAITSFSVTEEAFDFHLNPIRAKVDLGLKVLTSLEFPSSSVGRDAYISYQKNKERLAGEFSNKTDVSQIRALLPKPH
jgi:hypothetical protein